MNVNQPTPTCTSTTPRRTKSEFPIKAVTWLLPHGRAFQIHDKVKFMNKVVPVFFNQTKIRSFNRQLYMWGFRRIGRGDDQVWYHDNFLRGKPVDMKHMTRTKIKGKAAFSNEDVRVPNFDDLPPLPFCDKRPSAILDEMAHAILNMPLASGAIAHCSSTMPTLSPPQGNLTGDTNHQMVWPNTGGSQLMMNHCVTAIHYHLPLLPADTIESTQPMHQTRTSVVEPSYPTNSHMLREDVNDFCFSPPKQNKKDDFEPLPFMDDNAPCDDFASFIEGAIKLIGG
eukprot:scaffold29069_cov129-Skeletonema_marinoi.AAC.2